MQRTQSSLVGCAIYALGSSAKQVARTPFYMMDFVLKLVDLSPKESDLQKVENCLKRGAPYGSDVWATRAAKQLELESTLRPRARPRTIKEKGSRPL